MISTNIAKTRNETRDIVGVYAAIWGVSFGVAFARILEEVAGYIAGMTAEQIRDVYLMRSEDFGVRRADALAPGWIDDIEDPEFWNCYGAIAVKVCEAFPDLLGGRGAYQPVVDRIAVRVYFGLGSGRFDIVQDENEHPRSGGSPDFHGLPIIGQRDSEDYAADGTGEGVVSMDDLAAALEMMLPNREGLPLDELYPAYMND